MAQTVLSVVVEVEPASAEVLRGRIADLKTALSGDDTAGGEQYARLKAAVPALHFMALTIFQDDQYDPILVLEANFDGAAGPFWAQLESAIGERLRDLLRCAKPPRDDDLALFEAVTRDGSRAPVAPLLEARTVRPAVFHQGNRGLDRARIEDEGRLYAAVQAELDTGAYAPGVTAEAIHAGLRGKLAPGFPTLGQTPPPRVSALENAADLVRLIGFALMVVLVLAVPGLILSRLFAPIPVLLAAAAVSVPLFLALPGLGELLPKLSLKLAASGAVAVAVLVALFAAIGALLPAPEGAPYGDRFRAWAIAFGLGLAWAVPTVLGVLVRLRGLERRDPPQDAPPLDPLEQRLIAAREDKIAQNHMGSVVHLKPGVLRAVVIRAGLWGLGLILRVTAHNGYLSSMRTIHFAHWGITGNGGRLMFFSNFDGSWESYLDDFIEKAHPGLTLAWSSGIGFPPTRFLILDGATQGRKFKAWARHSMAESLFWFSAYKSFTVNQIERQARIADGLRKPVLSPTEAAAWALDL